jgi:glycosyltransferase involved in cell wall biosynthesis
MLRKNEAIKIKILQISDGYGFIPDKGPIEKVLFNLSKEMAKMGNEVTILERGYSKQVRSSEYIDGVHIIRLDKRRSTSNDLFNLSHPLSLIRISFDGLCFTIRAIDYLNKNGQSLDAIHVHLPFSSLAIVLLKRDLRKKYFYTFHGNDYRIGLASTSVPTQLLLRLFSPDAFLMKRVRRVIFMNEKIKAKAVSKGLIKDQFVEVIPNGTDIETDINAPEYPSQDLSTQNNCKIRILFVGLVTRRKGIEYLIKAAGILVNSLKCSNVEFLIVGKTLQKGADSNFPEEMSLLTKELGLQEHVKFLGWLSVEELRKVYFESDVFVLPSLSEASALVILEAMKYEKPIISTNVGSAPLMVKPGWNGFIVDPMDYKQLAEKIKYFVDHPEDKKRMGNNSRKLVEQRFSWKIIASEYLETYKT